MGKYNQKSGVTRTAVTSPIASTGPQGITHGGGNGYARTEKAELFLSAVSAMAGENSYYESGSERDSRMRALIAKVAVEDGDWILRFVPWLRNTANIRSMSVMIACEAVAARLAAFKLDEDVAIHDSFNERSVNRQLIDLACSRADEPGEIVAYWGQRFGRRLPKPVKRGLADAAERLYTEYSFAKYDSDSKGVRFADVLALSHAKGDDAKPWQDKLFGHIIADRYGRSEEIPETLNMLRYRRALLSIPVAQRRKTLLACPDGGKEMLAGAGMTWESLSGWLQGPLDKAIWEAVIPNMGFMAKLRNLRNFDQAGVSDEVAQEVADFLSDPEQVAKSRQLPMRFLSAYRAAAPSDRWNLALRKALDLSLQNVPELRGRTLIMVDTSGSMDDTFSKDGTLKRWDAAALFGMALAHRCYEADVVSFSNRTMTFGALKGESLLSALERWKRTGFFQGGGTYTYQSLKQSYAQHDRVVILTDEQAFYSNVGYGDIVGPKAMVYTYNLAGYERGHGPSGTGNYHTFGGLSDACFAQIPLLEAGRDADWPF